MEKGNEKHVGVRLQAKAEARACYFLNFKTLMKSDVPCLRVLQGPSMVSQSLIETA